MDVKLRNLGKKTLILVLSVLMVLTGMVFTTSNVSAAVVDSGNCGAEGDGSNVTWSLDGAGTLTISGTGAMDDYHFDPMDGTGDSPWYNYKDNITTLVIEEGITVLGECTAYNLEKLESVSLPSTLTTIPICSFAVCIGLTSITIPNSVTSIENMAFNSCYELVKVIILNKESVFNSDYIFNAASSNLKLYGYKDSTANTYATEKNIKFQALDEWLTIDDISTQYYKGSAVEPTVVVKDGESPLKLGDDYTVSYSNNDVAGEGIVTIKGKGDYEYATATKTFEIKSPVYTFTAGTNQSFTAGKATDLTFTAYGPLELLDKVYVNGIELDKANYTTASGSTIVTLKKDYLNTLTAGTYELKLTYTNGSEVKTNFTVAKADTAVGTKTPATGDTSNMGLWITLLVLAAGTTAVAYRKKTDK